MNGPDASTLKEAYRIPAAWRDLGLPGAPLRCGPSPFRDDRKPSFSVFDDGRRWRDFATGEAGDVVDFVATAKQCETREAFSFIRQRLGIECPGEQDRRESPRKKSPIPPLSRGTGAQCAALTSLRCFSLEGIRLAQERGILWFTRWAGRDAWAVADGRREMVEIRRLDGRPWEAFKHLPERKAHCFGRGKSWPVGIGESAPFPKIIFCEGAPDLVAAHHFIREEGKAETVAAVAMLGAGCPDIAPEALAMFTGKHVRFIPHLDGAGVKSLREWTSRIQKAKPKILEWFDLGGLQVTGGGRGKDLADVCKIAPECAERFPKFKSILP